MNYIRYISLSLIFLLGRISLSYGAYLDLAWNPNSEADLAGYRVYYGTSSGNYGSPVDVGNVTTYRLNGLNDGIRYYIALTAYDTSNNESAKSMEINGIPSDTQSPTVTITVPTSSPTFVTPIGTITVSGSASDNLGVIQVTWVNNRGGSGTAVGTESWSVSGINLSAGDNIITVSAHDDAHNIGTDSITITYTPPVTTSSSTSSMFTSTSTTTASPTTTTAPPTTTTAPVTTTQPPSTSTTVAPTTTTTPPTTTTIPSTTTQPPSTSTTTAAPTTTTAPPTTTTAPVTTTQPPSTSTTVAPTTTTTSIEVEPVSCDEPKKLLPLSLTASSELRPFFGIDNVIDGNPQTSWSTVLSWLKKDASIIMDMGDEKIITSVSMYASSIFGIDVLPPTIEIQLSNDTANWETVNSAAFSSSLHPPYADSWHIEARPWRYIKIRIYGRQSFFFFQLARIAELEIYGCDRNAEPPSAEANNVRSEHADANAHYPTRPLRTKPIEYTAPGIPGKPLVIFK